MVQFASFQPLVTSPSRYLSKNNGHNSNKRVNLLKFILLLVAQHHTHDHLKYFNSLIGSFSWSWALDELICSKLTCRAHCHINALNSMPFFSAIYSKLKESCMQAGNENGCPNVSKFKLWLIAHLFSLLCIPLSNLSVKYEGELKRREAENNDNLM